MNKDFDYLVELGSNFLAHYGVKGMKWKIRKKGFKGLGEYAIEEGVRRFKEEGTKRSKKLANKALDTFNPNRVKARYLNRSVKKLTKKTATTAKKDPKKYSKHGGRSGKYYERYHLLTYPFGKPFKKLTNKKR